MATVLKLTGGANGPGMMGWSPCMLRTLQLLHVHSMLVLGHNAGLPA